MFIPKVIASLNCTGGCRRVVPEEAMLGSLLIAAQTFQCWSNTAACGACSSSSSACLRNSLPPFNSCLMQRAFSSALWWGEIL